ncbi:MAG: hypothetical protein LRY55_08940, partial [Leadbetterella sp.]|nr:hypothetical protein [Leadbetterella sp.]
MKKIVVFYIVLGTLGGCTLDKTDYLAETGTLIPEYSGFKEVVVIPKDDYKITLRALNGTLYKGYNEIRVEVTGSRTGGKENVSG